MGCDIHPIAEVKENGIWRVNTDKVFRNPYYREEEKNKPEKERWECAVDKYTDTPSSSRSYDWFSILANVRNGYGFAGVPTGQGFDVIKQPVGLPDDVSEEATLNFYLPIANDPELENEEDENGVYYVSMKQALDWGGEIITVNGKSYIEDPDIHSVNFITVEEFNNFDWNQVTMKSGVISLKQYKELRGTNETPEMWSGGIGGGNNITISQEQADQILDGKNIELTRRAEPWSDKEEETKRASEWDINVYYQWSVLYSEWFEYQIKDTIEPLRQLADKYEDARMVFGFDN